MSEVSHRFEGWKYAEIRETIPYETAMLSDSEPTEEDYEFARELGRHIGAGER